MKSFFVLIVAISFVLLHQASADSSGSCAAEAQSRRDSCGQLVKPHGSDSGSDESGDSDDSGDSNDSGDSDDSGDSTGSTDSSEVTGVTSAVSGATAGVQPVECELVDFFYNISLLLDAEEREIFIEWIQEIQITILADSSLSADQQIVQISYSLQAFFEVNVDIEEVLYYEQLGSWGQVVDFVYVAYQIQIEITQSIVTLDASGDCALFDALRNATEGNSEQSAAVEALIANITIILQFSEWSYSQQQAQIYLLFEAFFVEYSQWESFFLSIQIEGFGLLQYYVDVTFRYEQIVTISEVVGGSVSNCELLQALLEASQNTSFSITVQNEFLELEQKLAAYFQDTSDVEARLSYVVSQCFSLFQLVEYMEAYVEAVSFGSWGSFYDLIFCSDICVNNGCGNPDNGPGTLPPSSSAAPSSEATTPAASTVPPAVCSSRWSLLEIQVSSNTTYFTDSVGAAYASWNATTKASFNTYWNQIRAAIWNTTITDSQVLKKVVTACSDFNSNNAYKQQILFNVTITEWYGTIGQFVACGKTL